MLSSCSWGDDDKDDDDDDDDDEEDDDDDDDEGEIPNALLMLLGCSRHACCRGVSSRSSWRALRTWLRMPTSTAPRTASHYRSAYLPPLAHQGPPRLC